MPDKNKACSKCGEVKPLEDFAKDASKKSGRRSDCKACLAAYMRARYAADRERLCRLSVERQKVAYARDPEKARARVQKWREENPEKHIAISVRWAEANPEKAREYKRKYDKANPEKGRASVRKRRALKRRADAIPYTEVEIYERDAGRCRGCRVTLVFEDRRSWEIDHIVPISLGGGDTPANVQLMCRPCNRSKGSRLEGQIHMPV